jgi:glycerophosphoryl diester phosphodiesterase
VRPEGRQGSRDEGARRIGLPPLVRVGHKGAEHLATPNTRESFEAAVEAGVDMIEFDVLKVGEDLVLAHDYEDAAERECMSYEDGLDFFLEQAFEGIALDVDIKHRGYEREVVFSLLERGLVERSIVSTTFTESLSVIGKLAPDLRRGFSIPRARRDYTKSALLAPPAYAVLRMMRRQLPGKARIALRAGRCEGLMVHWLLASPQLVEAVHGADGFVYAWTVDDPERIALLDAQGFDGVITNDPRLFDVASVGGAAAA